ncbi:MAG: pyridoxal-dependent decarboxylase, exosortase A system-associated [Methylococcales bacterium]|nr:pyridoxal-dependent decarboxylase, exosortase A system-associated [Methylococcales bacterium]
MTDTLPIYPENRFFPVENGQLLIGEIPLSRLAQRVGQTPFYAYDRQAIGRCIRRLRLAMPAELKIYYAIKANPMPAVVQHMATLTDGFDLASAGEMKLALDTGMPAGQMSFAGPGKRPQELSQAIAAGVTLNAESLRELDMIAGQCEILGLNANVALRINPDFELKAAGMKMGGGAKPFGIDEEMIPAALQKLYSLGLRFQGFHIYGGSQNLKAEAIIEAQQKSLDLAVRMAEYCAQPIPRLNIGGGLGVPYFSGDMAVDIDQVGDALAFAMANASKHLPGTEVVIELGRYLVSEAGVYVTRILDKKHSRGQVFLVTDGGLNHHLAATGNLGQVIRKNYPLAIGNRMDGKIMETVNIVGPLCTPLDVLADRASLPEAEPGDLVVVYQSGAYGYSASPAAFLSQPAAVEVLV